MAVHKVTCITKPEVNSTHEHITHLGNAAEQWAVSREDVILLISMKDRFYVVNPLSNVREYVEVVQEVGKAPYLRTRADGKWNDNLLSLDQCQ